MQYSATIRQRLALSNHDTLGIFSSYRWIWMSKSKEIENVRFYSGLGLKNAHVMRESTAELYP